MRAFGKNVFVEEIKDSEEGKSIYNPYTDVAKGKVHSYGDKCTSVHQGKVVFFRKENIPNLNVDGNSFFVMTENDIVAVE